MKNYIILIVFAFPFLFSCVKQEKLQNDSIELVMKKQEEAWNNGDIEKFMDGYWKNDSLVFIGKKGLTYGWQTTLDNYKKSYPDKGAMGKLQFTIQKTDLINDENAYIIGKWHLDRQPDPIGGHFTLLWKKIDGKWVIVADHTS